MTDTSDHEPTCGDPLADSLRKRGVRVVLIVDGTTMGEGVAHMLADGAMRRHQHAFGGQVQVTGRVEHLMIDEGMLKRLEERKFLRAERRAEADPKPRLADWRRAMKAGR
jgi:hypothetical protein